MRKPNSGGLLQATNPEQMAYHDHQISDTTSQNHLIKGCKGGSPRRSACGAASLLRLPRRRHRHQNLQFIWIEGP